MRVLVYHVWVPDLAHGTAAFVEQRARETLRKRTAHAVDRQCAEARRVPRRVQQQMAAIGPAPPGARSRRRAHPKWMSCGESMRQQVDGVAAIRKLERVHVVHVDVVLHVPAEVIARCCAPLSSLQLARASVEWGIRCPSPDIARVV